MSGSIVDEVEGIIMHVHVVNPEDIHPPKEEKGSCFTNTFTIVLTELDQPPKDLLPEDPYREIAVITAMDNPVVIHSSMATAGDPAATAVNLPDPKGAVIPITQPYPVPGTNRMWVTTAVYPSRVSVIVTRRTR